MKVTTWNVNGVRAREGQVFEWLQREKPDVLCLQEIKASRLQVPTSLTELPGYWNYWHGGGGGYSGVSLHVNRETVPVRPRFAHPAFDHENRIVTVSLGELVVASIYVPNGGKNFDDKVKFLDAMADFAKSVAAEGKQLVLCGDLNVALEPRDVHEKLRNAQVTGQTSGERAQLRAVISEGLVDLGRHFAPDDEGLFTWWAPWRNYRERNIGWRLDYVLVSRSLLPRAVSCRVERQFGTSDHGPLTATFEGLLFDPASVVEGPAEVIPEPPPEPEKKKKKKSQLSLL